MSVEILTEHHLEFLSLKGGCRGSSESTLVKKPHCWKSHVTAQMFRLQQFNRGGPIFGIRSGSVWNMSNFNHMTRIHHTF